MSAIIASITTISKKPQTKSKSDKAAFGNNGFGSTAYAMIKTWQTAWLHPLQPREARLCASGKRLAVFYVSKICATGHLSRRLGRGDSRFRLRVGRAFMPDKHRKHQQIEKTSGINARPTKHYAFITIHIDSKRRRIQVCGFRGALGKASWFSAFHLGAKGGFRIEALVADFVLVGHQRHDLRLAFQLRQIFAQALP